MKDFLNQTNPFQLCIIDHPQRYYRKVLTYFLLALDLEYGILNMKSNTE